MGLTKHTTANTRHISWTAIYWSHILTAQERRRPQAIKEYKRVSLGSRVKNQGLREAALVVARGHVPLSTYIKM